MGKEGERGKLFTDERGKRRQNPGQQTGNHLVSLIAGSGSRSGGNLLPSISFSRLFIH